MTHDYNSSVISLRPYRKEDFDELWSLDQECFPPGIAYTRFELGVYMRLPNGFALVAAEGQRIVGFIVCDARRKTGHVITIDVRQEARRRGVGSLLLGAAERRLREQGCTGLFLETAVDNAPALRFYERHGYSVLRTIPRYYMGTLDALRLGKNLSASEHRGASSE
jgi:ribosomal-protein-alanine N-acetyltransferase